MARAQKATRSGAGGSSGAAERVDVQLGRFGADGTIMVEINGRRVPVEGGITGEVVRLTLTGRRDRPHATVQTVLQPAPDRVTPRCRVIDICGGCEWQHINHADQLRWKATIVRRLLGAQRLPTRIDAVHPMADPWAYRIRAQIALGAEAGFRMRRSKEIVPLLTCPVADPRIARLLEDLNRLLRLKRLPDYRGRALLHVQVVGDATQPRLQLLLEGVDGLRFTADATLRAIADELLTLRSVESVSVQTLDGVVHLAGEAASVVTLLGRDVALPPGAFFQSNWSLLPALLERALHLAAVQPGEVAADIYGGVGVFGLFMAAAGAQVTLVEIEPGAVAAAQTTAAAWGIDDMTCLAASAADAITTLPVLDVALVDPPRTGLDEFTTAALCDDGPPRLIYVSCSPITFARDAARLVRAGYVMETYELFDFYPQTVHIEGLASFTRSDKAREQHRERRAAEAAEAAEAAAAAAEATAEA